MTHPPQQILVRVECKMCNGTGSISDHVPDYENEMGVHYTEVQVPCNSCKATGHTYEPATKIVLSVEEYEKLKQKQFQLGYLDARSEMEEEDFDL